MPEVKSAQVTISEHYQDHVHHKTVGKHPKWDREQGVICACGEVLGWPDPDNRETYSQYTQRVAREQVDAASAPGRIKGAFGTYGALREYDSEPEDGEPAAALRGGDNAPEPGDYPDPEVQEPPRHDDDPGPDEPEVDWGEPPADEPEPEVITIEDGDSEDVGSAPIPADAVPDERGNMISGGMSYGQVDDADEAQTWGLAPAPEGPPPWEGVDDATGDSVFPDTDDGSDCAAPGCATSHAPGSKFCDEHGGAPAGDDWPEEGKRAFAKSVVRGNREEPSVGSEVVPYAGTPIMPTDAQELDPLTGRLAPLDPTLPYTPSDVELKIVEILRQLENSELFLRQQLARLHQATHNLDFRYNLALTKSEQRAADQRKAEAWLATEEERREATEAEMLVRALRDSQHNLRAQLSGFQSVARSLAVSMVNALDGRERPPLPPEPPRWT